MSAAIIVSRSPGSADPQAFSVTVTDADGSETGHAVTLRKSSFEKLGGRGESEETFVRRCFEFLLQREPKESILRTFNIDVIATYFPDFPEEISQT